MVVEFLISFTLLVVSILTILLISKPSQPNHDYLPKSYPIFGSHFAMVANFETRVQWISNMLQKSPTATITLRGFLNTARVFTANPSNVEHILKTNFHVYNKGRSITSTLFDFLGDGIFNADGETWKIQRQVSSHEFNNRSLRKFIETVVDTEVSSRLLPVLSLAAKEKRVIDLQDVLERFAFDNVCKIAFGFDPECLLPSLPRSEFAEAFEDCVRLSARRLFALHPLIWKVKKVLLVGSERRLKDSLSKVRGFAKKIVNEKKEELRKHSSLESMDLLSRFLSSGYSDENFIVDVVISFILAGRDTTSAALSWFFWLIYNHPQVEENIVKEINEKSNIPIFEEVKDMIYTHASLCETMRLYPPVPADGKVAACDDVLPDGTVVRKGNRVVYHPYATGRLQMLWGLDRNDFKPDRWLKNDDGGKLKFVTRDPYSYPVFQAGPRVCLGKEFAFLQMKRVVAGILSRFKVIPATRDGSAPKLIMFFTAKMKGGFQVRIKERK